MMWAKPHANQDEKHMTRHMTNH